MALPHYEIFVRDANCLPQQALTNYSKLEMHLRFQDAGSWTLQMPQNGNVDVNSMLDAYLNGQGLGGIVVTRNGNIIFSGPIRGFESTGDFESIQDQESITFFGIDDTGLLASRLCMIPTPGVPLPQPPTLVGFPGFPFESPSNQGWKFFAYGITTDPASPSIRQASTNIYNLVSNNISYTSPFMLDNIQNRRIRQIYYNPGPLPTPPNPAVFGPIYSTRSRYENLLAEVKTIATYVPDPPGNYINPQNGVYEGLGFNILQQPGTQNYVNPDDSRTRMGNLLFNVFEPGDKTSTVVFSKGFKNLASYRYTNHGPEGNFVTCGGMNNSARSGAPFNVGNRFFFHKAIDASVTQFGLWEYFIDRRDIQYPLVEQNAPPAPPNPYALFPRPFPPNATYTQMLDEVTIAMFESLIENRNLIDMEIETIDISPTRFFEDYNVGDKVTVILNNFNDPSTNQQTIFQERIRDVFITLSYPEAEKITCRIGSQVAGTELNLFKKIKKNSRHISHLNSQY